MNAQSPWEQESKNLIDILYDKSILACDAVITTATDQEDQQNKMYLPIKSAKVVVRRNGNAKN